MSFGICPLGTPCDGGIAFAGGVAGACRSNGAGVGAAGAAGIGAGTGIGGAIGAAGAGATGAGATGPRHTIACCVWHFVKATAIDRL